MIVYFGERITVEVQGKTWREEKCQHCDGQFHYQLTLTASGSATNPYLLDSFWAPRRAEDAARSELDYGLKHHVLPIPCPHCALYQEYMVPAIRDDRLVWVRSVAAFFFGVAILLSLPAFFVLSWTIGSDRDSNWSGVAVVVAFPVVPLLVGFGLLHLRRRRVAAYDPNAEVYAQERRRIAADYALTPEQFAQLKIPTTPPGVARLGSPPPRSAQLVGMNCVRCGRRVSNELDSRFCRECGWPVHNECAVPAEGGCRACGAGAPPV